MVVTRVEMVNTLTLCLMRYTHLTAGILEILELDIIKDRLIGSEETGGLSTEQRKRCTIAVEMAANPSL